MVTPIRKKTGKTILIVKPRLKMMMMEIPRKSVIMMASWMGTMMAK